MRLFSSSSRAATGRRVALVTLWAAASGLAGACAKGFQPKKFTQAPELYRGSLREFQRKKWDNALAGLELLASQLPARDTLLPLVYFHQAQAHARKGEHLLAAQAYQRIGDAFPDDSLADDALYRQAREYQTLWRKPGLDAQYGQTSLATFRQVLTLYPESPLIPETGRQIQSLNEWFGTKDYETGMHYLRRKAYDPALIYFKDVTRLYPGTPSARRAYARMVESYRAINYREELGEVCTEMRRFYPSDADVARSCSGLPAATVATPTTPPSPSAPPPTSTGTPSPTSSTGPPPGESRR